MDKINLVWFRNDLRIRDNENLFKAIEEGKPIVAIYCFDKRQFNTGPFGFQKIGGHRAQFLIETVSDLKQQLANYNIPLVTVYGKTEEAIAQISQCVDFSTIYCQEEWTKEEVAIENAVKAKLPQVQLEKSYSQFLVQPEELLSIVKSIPNSFTSFRKKAEKYIDIRQEYDVYLYANNDGFDDSCLDLSDVTLKDLGYPSLQQDKRTAFPFKGGETAGLARLKDYLFTTQKVSYYKETRNGLVGVNYSTKLSAWLANGSLSAVTIYHEIKKYEAEVVANQSTYWVIFELLWRDFFKYIALKYNNNIFLSGGIQQKQVPWLHDEKTVQAWVNGQTKCDFVNANMIELKETGWMSNRGRQNVASYFAKTLHQDWRIGASYFESQLIDYDVHSNYGNWMYVSGVGNDGRDSKFNTQLQAKRYDENGKFRKRWLQAQLF